MNDPSRWKVPPAPGRLTCCALALLLPVTLTTKAGASTLLDPQPENSTSLFGRAVAVVGDIDGDGHPDLAVGAPFQDGEFKDPTSGFGEPQNVGKVFLLNGVTLSVIRQLNDPKFQMIQSLKFGGQFGSAVAAAGDINQDGVPDVLVGVPHHIEPEEDENEFNSGLAFVFSGADGSVLLTLEAPEPQEGARLGYAVAGLGDVSGDGIPDLLVGAAKRDNEDGVEDVGAAYLYSGADGKLIRELAPPDQGGAEANGRFGSAVANAGDVNNDGKSDILIGAPGNSRVYLFNGATGALLRTIVGPSVDALPSFGASVAGGKDVNRDGSPDIAIGAPLENKLSGAVYLYNSDGTLQRKLSIRKAAFSKFGSSVALTDDLTGDRQPDVLVGAPDQTVNNLLNAGQAYLFRGSNGKLTRTISSAEPKAYAGFGSVVNAGDLNGDQTVQIVVGTPYQNADLIDPDDGDLVTHLQIGQIEVQ